MDPPAPKLAAKPPQPLPSWRVKCGRAVPWTVALLFICVCVQVALAAFGIFGRPEAITAHKSFVHVFELLPVVLAVLGFLGRDVTAGIFGIVLFVVIGAQYGFIQSTTGEIQALHVVNAFLIFGSTLVLLTKRLPWAKPVA